MAKYKIKVFFNCVGQNRDTIVLENEMKLLLLNLFFCIIVKPVDFAMINTMISAIMILRFV